MLVTPGTARPAVLDALAEVQPPAAVFSVGGAVAAVEPFEAITSAQPATPLPGATEGADMLYPSGATGRPKGVKPPLTGLPVGSSLLIADLGTAMTGLDAGDVYLSPAPFYHAAPRKWSLVDFRAELPREPTGKLLKRKLRDEYWAGRAARL